MGSSVRELAGATPATRDRYVDLLRVSSLGAVVLGHWLMAAVTPDGVGNLLAVVPALQPLTWLLQVMPVFFFVGGFSHALSYRSLLRKRPGAAPGPPRTPSTPPSCGPASSGCCAPPWSSSSSAAALLVQLLGGGGGLTGVTLRMVTQPLWFIGIYLAMVAFTPPLLKLHERYGWGRSPVWRVRSSRWRSCGSPPESRMSSSSTSRSSGWRSTSSASCAPTAASTCAAPP